MEEKLLSQANELATLSVLKGCGPFGCVITDSELNEIRRSISNIVELMIIQNNYQKQILNIDISAQYRKINNLKADISNSTKELNNLTKFCSIQ